MLFPGIVVRMVLPSDYVGTQCLVPAFSPELRQSTGPVIDINLRPFAAALPYLSLHLLRLLGSLLSSSFFGTCLPSLRFSCFISPIVFHCLFVAPSFSSVVSGALCSVRRCAVNCHKHVVGSGVADLRRGEIYLNCLYTTVKCRCTPVECTLCQRHCVGMRLDHNGAVLHVYIEKLRLP